MNIVYEIYGYDLIINLRIRVTPNFGQMVMYKQKKKINEDTSRAQRKNK